MFPTDGDRRLQYNWYVYSEALPGGLQNRGTRDFISGEQGNKGLKMRGTGEQRQFQGNANIHPFNIL